MPFNARLDRVIGFIQREHDKAAAEADARRPNRTRHHDLLLIEDAPVRSVCVPAFDGNCCAARLPNLDTPP